MRTATLQNHGQARVRRTALKKSNSFIKLTFCILAAFIVYQTFISVMGLIG
ncbi:hypothetical protein EV198_3484 [Roseivirga ehrenbergii]|uniref:hypothetical protein n=1 Tax=Roseivirga ehrenbergii (strain DSM 102268 / JCM 13514 / KCTC 12282 / NCIMB 14502 / KMM 6017) TaxID=279360 RepID=UPI000B33D650|nr:hypothetical protein [Roseivirga ehrenbergii]TCK99653.1 hypothetical protein EV198_3484 [Roseivirga ehrenbergii]